MPDAQSTDPTPIATGIRNALGPSAGAGDEPPPLGASQQQAVSQPIGVPYYQIDPATGQPAIGPDGQPTRFAAHPQIPNDTNTMDSRGGLVHAGGQFDTVPPRYFDGDQWLPASLPPDQLAALQKAMVSAGLLKPGQAQLGVWDQASMSAYTQLLAFANASGTDVSTALSRWGSAHTTDATSTNAPLTVRVSNPDELRQVFRKAVIDTLGQGWDQAKIDSMVNAYQGVETQAQYQQYAMTGAGSPTDPGTGGTVTTPPSPQAFAEAQARAEDPAHAQEHDSLGFIDSFNQLVGKWSG